MKTKCPHCGDSLFVKTNGEQIGVSEEGWEIVLEWYACPSCGRHVVLMSFYDEFIVGKQGRTKRVLVDQNIIEPPGVSRVIPEETPKDVRKDFIAACKVLSLSPEASAALSRRCLQTILNNHLGIERVNLSEEIDEAIRTSKISGPAADALHNIRIVGNFAAHPKKSQVTGEIMDVEPGEAEGNLSALEMVIDYCFVQPRRLAEMDDMVKKKKEEARKNWNKPET